MMPASSRPGAFITLEGVEGAGKSSQIAGLAQLLEEAGCTVMTTREPGGTPIAERIRALLLDADNTGMADATELLLMFAARAEHLTHKIIPALQAGTWVISDRFTDATYAYQGGGRGIAPERIALLEDWVQQGMQPDLTLLFDLPPEVGLARARGRGKMDRFEAETLQFFTAAREVYLQRAAAAPQRFAIIDAACPFEEVHAQIKLHLREFLARRGLRNSGVSQA